MTFRNLALLCLTPAAIFAQESTLKIPASFYAFDYVPGQETVFVKSGAETHEKIRLSKANIIGPVESAIIDGALTVHSAPVVAEGKATHPVLSTAKVPADVKRALVVMFPEAENPPKTYRSIVFDYSLASFPLGVYRLINLSPRPIRGSVAKDYVEVKPGGIGNLEPQGEPGAMVPVKFEYFDEGRWNLLTETRCAIRKDRRWLVSVYQDPASGRMNIRSIPDRAATPVATTEN